MRRAFQYFDKYLADEGGSKKTENAGMVSNGARIVGCNMLLYFTIGCLTLEKVDDEGMRKLHDMAETAIKDYSNPSLPNSRFASPMKTAAGLQLNLGQLE
ncbi:hypothetical protein BWQ96_07511 [Gracilariopsis chorda]|uniref:Uncharacterized protein n=1 Tax=Gracilariopsis chorda TaxID=448386 RepID=A0A2V3IL38_9FLOR|nr:hypothetical protein BWQ96_07511 [Gracilariopsis chorda]|eukprot:PXF42759.1 hypothetical protein BWQ96_07511 [Gracilariopsis chorda]